MTHPPSRITLAIAWVLLSVGLTLPLGCGPRNAAQYHLTQAVGSLMVKSSIDGGGSSTLQGDDMVIKFKGGTLIVRQRSIDLNGKTVAQLPPGTERVEVDYTASRLTITVDGKSVLSQKI